jgi:hypothetical protein
MSNANFEAPKIGDGQQMGDGNVEETLNVGRSGQPVQMQPSATGKVRFLRHHADHAAHRCRCHLGGRHGVVC